MSLSNGDPLSAITDVVVAQDLQTRMMEETQQKMVKMNKQLLQLERLIQIANRNLNAMSKLQKEQAAIANIVVAPTSPTIDVVPSISQKGTVDSHSPMRTTAFSRPRRRTSRLQNL